MDGMADADLYVCGHRAWFDAEIPTAEAAKAECERRLQLLLEATRGGQWFAEGLSPRAGLAWLRAARAKALKLHGLLAHWEDIATTPWVAPLIAWEEDERARRGLERRLSNAHLGRFKPLADFDWHWPTQCDRSAIEDLMGLRFLGEAANVVLVGPNGVGKTMIARNIAHQAVLAGHTVLFTSAGHMLNELAGADGDNALRHRLSVYARPRLLVVDEVGYLSYSNRHADLLFEIVSRRYEAKSTLITTNRPFAQWGEVFPNAACVVSLVDRLVHHAQVIALDGDSYRTRAHRTGPPPAARNTK
jgi:DNA replication protein DnaC